MKTFYGAENRGQYDVFAPNIPLPSIPYTIAGEQRTDQCSLYGQLRSHLTDRLSVIIGGRDVFFEQRSQTVLPSVADWKTAGKQNGKLVPYGGAIYELKPATTAYASYAKIFSVQASATFTGEAIAPFSGEQFEAGLKGSFLNDRLTATVAGSRINGNHLAVSDQLHPGFYVDSGAVRSQGSEFEVAGTPLPNRDLIADYTLADTRNVSNPSTQGQAYGGETPQHLFKIWSTYRFAQGSLEGFTVGAGAYVQSSTYRTTSYGQGGYPVWSAKLGYRFSHHLSADLSFDDLFDKQYFARAPYTSYSEYGAPRGVMLTPRATY